MMPCTCWDTSASSLVSSFGKRGKTCGLAGCPGDATTRKTCTGTTAGTPCGAARGATFAALAHGGGFA
eukprot:10323021-Lingulodinium_polyedra.AAC.1